jgi:hypothetical protein
MGLMYHEKNQLRRPLAVLAAALLLGAALLLPHFAHRWSGDVERQSEEAIRSAVVRAAAQCYSVEGVYPQSLDYLEAHYGLVINHKKYIVSYEPYSSNLMPEIRILRRGEEWRL